MARAITSYRFARRNMARLAARKPRSVRRWRIKDYMVVDFHDPRWSGWNHGNGETNRRMRRAA